MFQIIFCAGQGAPCLSHVDDYAIGSSKVETCWDTHRTTASIKHNCQHKTESLSPRRREITQCREKLWRPFIGGSAARVRVGMRYWSIICYSRNTPHVYRSILNDDQSMILDSKTLAIWIYETIYLNFSNQNSSVEW